MRAAAAAAAPPFSSPFSTTLTTHHCGHASLPVRKNDSLAPQERNGGLGVAVFSVPKSSSSSSDSYRSRHERSIDNKKTNDLSSTPLSGSDVLLALQKAAAEKAKRAAIRKGKKGKRVDQAQAAAAEDHSKVRPLNIRSDWGARLDELERLLQELKMEDGR